MSEAAGTAAIARFYGRAAWRYPHLVVGTLLGVPLTVLVNTVLPPLVIAHVLDRLSRHDYLAGHVVASFRGDIVAYVVLRVLGGVVTWRIVDIFAWRLEANVERDLAQQSFDHLVRESADFHANAFGGGLVSATTKLLGSYVRIADTTIFQVFPLVISLVAVVVITAGEAPVFAVLLSLFAGGYLVVAVFLTRPVRRVAAQHAEAESAETGALADAVTNVMAVKSFAREEHERTRFDAATDRTRLALLQMMRVAQRQNAVFGTLTSSISAMAFAVALYSVVDRGVALGIVFLILNYTTDITQQLFQYSNNALRTYNRAFGDAGAMVGILAETPAVVDPARPEVARLRSGAVSFENVSFSHAGSGVPLFDHFDLTIAPGEKVGLVGHSGAGKSSFVRLLLRFSDVDGGRILIDGQDIAGITQADLRAAIAYVPQEPLLFHRTISENVAYGRLEAPADEVRRAARRANAAGFIETLPQGYDTLVGERGVKLSGGQRQRIAVARAMLKDAPILLLDEATSALDSESEVLIQDALWKLMEGRTAVVIAHRLSTVQRLDRIVVLDDGAVAEVGTHSELLERGGTYAAFWAHQSGAALVN